MADKYKSIVSGAGVGAYEGYREAYRRAHKIGTGLGAKGKLDRKRKKWSDEAHGMGDERAQEFMEKKERKFKSKRTKSEKIADEVEDGVREIGGKKKRNYPERKKKLY